MSPVRHWLVYNDAENPDVPVTFSLIDVEARDFERRGFRVVECALATDAEHGRTLVDRMFELPRGPEWEQALAELRVWSMTRP